MQIPVVGTKPRTWNDYHGDLARPLNVLVWKGPGPKAEYHATCVQYPKVYARGKRDIDAVASALDLLLDYLFECEATRSEPMDVPTLSHQRAFSIGKPLNLSSQLGDRIPVRVNARKPAREASKQSIDRRETLDVRECEAKELASTV
jgi:hypothetical protein